MLTYGAGMTRERAALLGHLEAERKHVLAVADGLDEGNLIRAVAPSGWSIAQLLNHLTYDDEVFWACCRDRSFSVSEDAINYVRRSATRVRARREVPGPRRLQSPWARARSAGLPRRGSATSRWS